MSSSRVVYNGVEMAAEWPARIEAAQGFADYMISGLAYARILYGGEQGGPFPEPCHDCGGFGGSSTWSSCATWRNVHGATGRSSRATAHTTATHLTSR